MNNLDKKYTDLLQDILDNGVQKQDRTGTGTLSVFGRQIRHKMSEGFPLLTTKKMYFKGIVTELLWFLRGDTNIKYLVDNDCHIWDGDCYSNYGKKMVDIMNIVIPSEFMDKGWVKVNSQGKWDVLSKEEFINKIKTDDEFVKKWGELGPVYGKQWRDWESEIGGNLVRGIKGDWIKTDPMKIPTDQIANLINELKTNPDSRRLMVNAWNVGELDQMVLPPCHYGFQVYTRELSLNERHDIKEQYGFDCRKLAKPSIKQLDDANIPTRAISLMWNQRSVDTFLGLPFNIASYGLLLEIIAKEVNMVPDELIGNLGDTHLYLNHIEQAKEQIGRELSLEERYNLIEEDKHIQFVNWQSLGTDRVKVVLDENNVPTRTREPFPLPKLMICGDMTRTDGFTVPFDELDHSLIKLIDYQSHPTIKAPLSN
jgi:thymidylate synthase